MLLIRQLPRRAVTLKTAALRSAPLSLRFFTSDKETSNGEITTKAAVYVHPLSQIVLLYFQQECHHWIVSRNLDRNLTLHRDGTFVLEGSPGPTQHDGRNPSFAATTKSPRIWTCYDPIDKKHWLSFSMMDPLQDEEADEGIEKSVQHRFLLQDNLMPAWQHGNRRKGLSERVQDSVVELMQMVDQEIVRSDKGQNNHHRRD